MNNISISSNQQTVNEVHLIYAVCKLGSLVMLDV